MKSGVIGNVYWEITSSSKAAFVRAVNLITEEKKEEEILLDASFGSFAKAELHNQAEAKLQELISKVK